VSSDGGLQRLQSDERAARAGALAGAGDPAGIVAAVEALRAAAWRELTAELAPAADPGLVADLGHRLAHVCSVVAQAALTRPRSPTRCALLVLEVDDVERLLSAEPEGALAQELQEAEHELTAVLRPGDRLTREQAGRWSVIAPDADPASARELAERLSRAFAACAPARHGVRLTLSIGLAVAADAGAELADLEAEAQVGLFAARAAGRPLA
jgi:GGDEF domain-containing protein